MVFMARDFPNRADMLNQILSVRLGDSNHFNLGHGFQTLKIMNGMNVLKPEDAQSRFHRCFYLLISVPKHQESYVNDRGKAILKKRLILLEKLSDIRTEGSGHSSQFFRTEVLSY